MRRSLPVIFLLSACSDVFASDNFDYDAHGWGLEGQTLETRPSLDKTHGNPTGNICASDDASPEDRPWRFVGSRAYTGNALAFFGRSITWEATTTNANPSFILNDFDAVFIENQVCMSNGTDGGLSCTTLSVSAPPENHATATTQWTKLFVALDLSSHWRTAQPDGGFTDTTEEELRHALSNITGFRIRGEWSADPEESCIDNIVFGAR